MRLDLLKRLTEAAGIPGYEDRLRAIVGPELEAVCDEVSVDALGNVVGVKRGTGAEPRRKVMVAGHIDEIGFMVKYISDEGFLRLQSLGGFDPRALFQQRVMVHAGDGQSYRGVLAPAAKPAHLLSEAERGKSPQLSELYVDLALPGEKVKAAVGIGDMVTLDRTTEEIGDCVIGKAMDDRLSVFVMIEAMRALRETTCDIYVVATTQEEVGLRGATTSAYAIAPDISIALDVTLAMDLPGGAPEDRITKLGGGTAIKLMDSASISHPKLVRFFRDVAEREGIPHQLEILPRGGTDAGAMQRVRGGSAAITLSTPTRYVHTVNEMVHKTDVQAGIDLLARVLERAHEIDTAL
ncbi:MAG: peptidase M42 [uncultured Thermomicrobiales bacterium]|uniref:Peptidase M42 n=1 Tax=uncultured Thermomicrobiales bacterium TaxID=1645740 RepID=A0A6J4V4L2_9BACT|nr:MAG: peptidase M42 [uncultured Thermomicrobiales bacterium]